MGMMEGVQYEEYSRACLTPGDVLIIGTDGIWEAENLAQQQFGKDRLRAILRAHAGKPAPAIADALEAELTAFRAGAEQKDDITFVIAKMLPA